MIVSFAKVPNGSTLQTDLCIIGAGAAGIALAREYINRAFNVVLLESGGLEVDSRTEQLNAGESAGAPFAGFTEGRRRVFGGTTAAWAGQCLELDPIDFEARSWIPSSGWPFERAELESYYRRAEHVFGVSGERYDEAVWKRFGIPAVPFDVAKLRSAFTVFSPTPHLGHMHRRLIERSANVRLYLGATATKITTTPNGSATTGIELRDLDGRRANVRARAYVLCTGGIEPARLLLASRDADPRGVGNANDLVGRYFQDHPNCFTAEIRTDRAERLQNLYGLLYRGRKKYWPKIGLAAQLQRERQVLNAVATLAFESPQTSAVHALRELVRRKQRGERRSITGAEVAALACGAGDVAHTAYRRFVLGRSPATKPARILLQCYLEQAPQRESRITLTEHQDALGVPYPRIDWKISELERTTLRVLTETIGTEFQRLRLGTVRPFGWLDAEDKDWQDRLGDAFHHSGATRMSRDPARGVVDINCQVHGVNGLYIAGGSTFPAAGFANPTLTIAALAIRLGDHLKETIFA